MTVQLPPIADPRLRDRAFTHRSFVNEHPDSAHNERLEFLGDALLGFLVADLLYEVYPDMSEAAMTRLRSQLVGESQLAAFARQFGLGEKLSLGRGAENDGSRDSDAVLSDAFEAYVAAVYLDSGLDRLRECVDAIMEAELDRLEADGTGSAASEPPLDIKGQFQQWALLKLEEMPTYTIVAESGPPHDRTFTVEVRIGGRAYGRGTGKRKQEAEKAAAQEAIAQIQANDSQNSLS